MAEIRRTFQLSTQQGQYSRLIPALMGRDDGGGSYTTEVPGSLDLFYVRVAQASNAVNLTAVRNPRGISVAANTPIWLDVDNGGTMFIHSARDFEAAATGGGASALDDLSDVDTTTTAPVAGDLLRFDGSNWVPETQIGAEVYHNASQNVPTSTPTVLAFNSEAYDMGELHNTVSNNSRLTAPVAGVYVIELSIEWSASGTGNRQMTILLNGATVRWWTDDAVAGAPTRRFVSTIKYLSASDYVQASVFQASGGTLQIQSVSPYSPRFSMWKMR